MGLGAKGPLGRIVAMVCLLSLSGCSSTPLMRAASERKSSEVQALLASGANPNEMTYSPCSGEQGTPLMCAIYNNDLETMRILIDGGADLNVTTLGGRTPLGIALSEKRIPAIKLLVERGATKLYSAPYSSADDLDYLAQVDSQTAQLLEQKRAPRNRLQGLTRPAAQPEPPPAPAAEPKIRAVLVSDVDAPRYKLAENLDDFAVVIGVEKYSNDLPDAQFAERDAAAVRNHLLALGTPERNIKFLTGTRASKGNLEAYVEDWLPRNIKPDSRVFFYFSGHGAPDPKSNLAYLVPFDGSPNYLDKTAYSLKKLYAHLNTLKAKQVIVALDSCFSGSGGRSVLPEGARPLVTQVDSALPPGGKITLLAAASPTEITATLRDQGHGLFTYYLLKGIDDAARGKSQTTTARGLYEYLRPKVQDAASRQNRDQTPVLEGNFDADFLRQR